MTQKEAAIVASILSALRARGAWCVKIHGGMYQSAGIPDIIGVSDGRFFGLEVKRPGGKATQLQLLTIRRIREAGGIGAVVTSIDEAMGEVYGDGRGS